MAAMAVVTNAGHVIELADGTHYGARIVLLHRLSSSSHQQETTENIWKLAVACKADQSMI